MTAQTCPHCRAPARGGGRPTCLCAAAEADDFDPLRIRPYVSLPDAHDGKAGSQHGDDVGGEPDGTGFGRGDPLADLPGVDAAVHHGIATPDAARPTGGASARAPGGAATPTASRSPSPDATASESPVRPHRPTPPRPPAPTRAAGSVSDSPATHGPSAPPTGPIVLREGAGGPEVVELQERLGQLAAYPGPDDGRYDADVRDAVSRYQRAYGVAGDADGVYGAPTRVSLEARTDEP
ncbi:peptidoglycan-binding protein [Streptomyces sp. NPDC058773]|uniref:peptidoglycan-binding domain-containing protein n=1 Tax=Streptomyces sp. NPDC058773 TaxID=3346632 RepID=UPI0036BD5753